MARCQHHPDREAVTYCSRCGDPVCAQCLVREIEPPLCVDCSVKKDSSGEVEAPPVQAPEIPPPPPIERPEVETPPQLRTGSRPARGVPEDW